MGIDFDKLKEIKEKSIEINKKTAELEMLNQQRLAKIQKEAEEAENRAKHYPKALKIFENLEGNLTSAALNGYSEYTVGEYFNERDGYDSESGNIHDYGKEPEYWKYLLEILKENKIPYNVKCRSRDGGMYSSSWTDYYTYISIKI